MFSKNTIRDTKRYWRQLWRRESTEWEQDAAWNTTGQCQSTVSHTKLQVDSQNAFLKEHHPLPCGVKVSHFYTGPRNKLYRQTVCREGERSHRDPLLQENIKSQQRKNEKEETNLFTLVMLHPCPKWANLWRKSKHKLLILVTNWVLQCMCVLYYLCEDQFEVIVRTFQEHELGVVLVMVTGHAIRK